MTPDDMREELALRDAEILDTRDLFDVFMNGCVGYANMSDDEIRELHQDYIKALAAEDEEEIEEDDWLG